MVIHDERGPSKEVPDRMRSGGIFEDCEGTRDLEVRTSSNIPESKKEDAMLVLSRKLNEKIVIDGGIVVTVVKIDRNQIRLGIEAPSACSRVPRRDRRSHASSRCGRSGGGGRLNNAPEGRPATTGRGAIGERLKKRLTMTGSRLDNPRQGRLGW